MDWRNRNNIYQNIDKLWEDEARASSNEYKIIKNERFVKDWKEEWDKRFGGSDWKTNNPRENFAFLQEFKESCKQYLGRSFTDEMYDRSQLNEEYKIRKMLADKLPDCIMKGILKECQYDQAELNEAQALYNQFEHHYSTHAYYKSHDYRMDYDAIEEQVSEWKYKSSLVHDIARRYVPENIRAILYDAKYESSLPVKNYPAELNAYQQMHVDKALDEYKFLKQNEKLNNPIFCLNLADKFNKMPENTHIYAELENNDVKAMMAGAYSFDLISLLTDYARSVVDEMLKVYKENEGDFNSLEVQAEVLNYYESRLSEEEDKYKLLLLSLAQKVDDGPMKDVILGKVISSANMNAYGYKHEYGKCFASAIINTAYDTLKNDELKAMNYQNYSVEKYNLAKTQQNALNQKEEIDFNKQYKNNVEL